MSENRCLRAGNFTENAARVVHTSSRLARTSRRVAGALTVATLLFLPAAARAQQSTQPPRETPRETPAAAAPTAAAADVASIDAIVAALYDVISGPAGEKRDWDRFRSLFIPSARLIPTGISPEGVGRHRMLSPDEYARNAAASLERDGFFEREIGRRLDRFGNIAHVFSAYDSRRTAEDAEPFARGINSIQLWNDGTRWYVVTIFWQPESDATPIPAEYLDKP